ncbi:unnamed protein product [Alternaria sp. RS040]
MSWASNRQTKRKEDMAYCLLGLFEVHMPLIYGEGAKAFLRLQEEIIKRNNDLSIFAWNSVPQLHGDIERHTGIFASSPTLFEGSSAIYHGASHAEFSLTNRGLLLTSNFALYKITATRNVPNFRRRYVLIVGGIQPTIGNRDRYEKGIFLRKYGPSQYCRIDGQPLAEIRILTEDHGTTTSCFGVHVHLESGEKPIYVCADGAHNIPNQLLTAYRLWSVHVPEQEQLEIVRAVPRGSWDHVDSIFFQQKMADVTDGHYQTVLAVLFELSSNIPFAEGYDEHVCVICKSDIEHTEDRRLKVFIAHDYLTEYNLLFHGSANQEGIRWDDLMRQAPKLLSLSESVDVKLGPLTVNVNFFFKDGPQIGLPSKITVSSLMASINLTGMEVTPNPQDRNRYAW